MSIEALNYAVRVGDRLSEIKDAGRLPDGAKLTPTDALLLLHLCNHVDGMWRWESDKKKLAKRCMTTPRSIQSGLSKFQEWGLISLRRFVGQRGQDLTGFEFWVHEDALKRLCEDPETFFKDLGPVPHEVGVNPGNAGSENISTPGDGLWITGVENISTPANTRSENISTPVGSEIYARSDVENFHPQRARTSSNPHENPHSSSPPHGGSRSGTSSVEPPAAAGGEEEPSGGRSRMRFAGSPAASGGDQLTRVGEVLGGKKLHRHQLGSVDVDKVQQALSGVSGAAPSEEMAIAFIDRILDRTREKFLKSPTGYVVSAIRQSPGRTKADLQALSQPEASSGLAASSSPVPCPIPAHAEHGRWKANCPSCRGKFGVWEFPEVISTAVYDQLDEEVQANIRAAEVNVVDQVDHATMRRTIDHPIRKAG